jgi:hypothetical protein
MAKFQRLFALLCDLGVNNGLPTFRLGRWTLNVRGVFAAPPYKFIARAEAAV